MKREVGGKYLLRKRLGYSPALAAGGLYLARDKSTGDEVAAKTEWCKVEHPSLLHEAKVYRCLRGERGIPALHWFGQQGQYNVMVMQLLGASVEWHFNHCGRLMPLQPALMIVDRALRVLQGVHSKGIVHRDVTPGNLLFGVGEQSSRLHLTGFRVAKRFRDRRTCQHIPKREGRPLVGTARFASLANHRGEEKGRRDDLESLAYVLVYLAKGRLPWQGLRAASKEEKFRLIKECKETTPVPVLCAGLPREVAALVEYCRSLPFDAEPDYRLIHQLVQEAAQRIGADLLMEFDWSKFHQAAAGGGHDR